MNDIFISCDWGTSSFRIRLVHTPTLEVIHALEDANLGFGQQSLAPADNLQQFEQHIQKLCAMAGLKDIPLSIISGMASSSIGIINMPYGILPLALNDFRIPYEALSGISSQAYLISGLATDEDVMRGEEVQVLGAAQKLNDYAKDYLVILPGTHSKHIIIEQGQLLTFKTYLTGELFSLLQSHSILRHSVKRDKIDLQNPKLLEAFNLGLSKSSSSLLHEFFSIRARQILQHTDPVANYSFLSGLLIGSELRTLEMHHPENLILCADQPVLDVYTQAIRELFPAINLHLVSTVEATILGHYKLLQQIHAS